MEIDKDAVQITILEAGKTTVQASYPVASAASPVEQITQLSAAVREASAHINTHLTEVMKRVQQEQREQAEKGM